MQDQDEYGRPKQGVSIDEPTESDTPMITIAERRKLVGVVREANPARPNAVEYLGRRWLSRR